MLAARGNTGHARMQKPKRLNQTAIAKATGVSRATVSLVLRGGSGSSRATKAKVLAAAKKMGYRPNALVHSIRSGKSRTIGVLVQPHDTFWKDVCHGIHDRLIEAEHLPLFLWQDVAVRDEATALRQIHRLLDRWVDGVILWPNFAILYAQHLREFQKRNIPLVTIDHVAPRLKADTITSDESQIAALIADHLLPLGHRAFLVVSGPKGLGWADERCQALRHSLNRAGKATLVELRSDLSSDVSPAIAAALQKYPSITAAIGCSDHLAALVYRAAERVQKRIPGQLSVMGVGGLDFSGLMSPPLATIAQNGYAVGRKAAEAVLARSLGQPAHHHEIAVRLIPGGSTGPVRGLPAAPSSAPA
jgi:LacI family transcriptional regulator